MNTFLVGSSEQGYPILAGAIFGTIQNLSEFQKKFSKYTNKKGNWALIYPVIQHATFRYCTQARTHTHTHTHTHTQAFCYQTTLYIYLNTFVMYFNVKGLSASYSRAPLTRTLVVRIASYVDRSGASGKFVENSTKLTCLEITGYRIKYSTVLWLLEHQDTCCK